MACLIMVLLSIGSLSGWSAEVQKTVEQPVRDAIRTRQATQKQEVKWRAEKDELAARFEQLQAQHRQLQARRDDLNQQAEAARARVAKKARQLADIQQIADNMRPFLEALLSDLEQMVAEGMPFLIEERQHRLANLEEMLATPDTSVSDLYRKVMEALLVEAEYGFTIEVYQENLLVENQSMLVNVFRLGCLNLFFQSLDSNSCGFYNVADGKWQFLPSIHNPAIQAAIAIGSKQRPVELLSLPLGRMVAQ